MAFEVVAFKAQLMPALATPPSGNPQAVAQYAVHLLPNWTTPRGGMKNGNPALVIETATTGSFSGTVSVNSVLVANAVVKIYKQAGGELVATTKTNAVGAYTISGLSPNATYLMVADDPASAENSGVYAREAPA